MHEESAPGSWASLYRAHAAEWDRRIADACGACGVDGVVVFSGAAKYRYQDDIKYPFFAEPYFKAWAPTAYPDSVLKIVPGQTPILIWLRHEDFWHMPTPEPSGFWTQHMEIRSVSKREDLQKELGGVSRLAGIGEEAQEEMGLASVNDKKLLTHLDYHRAWKTRYEIACIEEANRVAAPGHAAATSEALAARLSEFELHSIYCRSSGQRESSLPYQSIVAFNQHTAILHYQNLDAQPPERFRSFLLDSGACHNGYASDITRTWASPGDPFADLIASMNVLQRTICDEARSGTCFISLHDRSHQLLAEVLAEHGIIRCSAEEGYDRGLTRTFLPHGLGHLLGLQVHDAGGHLESPEEAERNPPSDHPFLRLTRSLAPGFVVTIEPGLYFIPALLSEVRNGPLRSAVNWETVERWQPYGGIRIEDDVLVTETGSRNLTRPAMERCGIA